LTAESTDANSNTATITITNDGTIKGDGTSQNPVIEITQSGGSATLNNTRTSTSTGIIESATPSASSIAISETGGSLTVNNDGTIIGVVNADLAFNNNAGGTWDVAGTNTFTGASNTISNAGIINVEGTSSFATTGSNTLTISNTGTLNIQTGTLTLGGVLNVSGGGSVTLASGTGLADASGVTFGIDGTTQNGLLTGVGTIAANLSLATGSNSIGSTITAKGGGKLDLTGSVSSGLILAIDTGATNTLKIDGTATAASAINSSSNGSIQTSLNSTSTLEIGASGNLTINAAQIIAGGTLQLDSGSSLTDTSGITVSSGSVTGAGTLAADLTATGGTIQASNGTLDVTGTLTGGSALSFVSGGTLKVSGSSSTNTANAFTLAAGTLEVSSNLTISGAQSVTGGTLQLDSGSTLTDTSGITVSSGTFTGQGTAAADLTGSGTGVIKASGGVLDVTGTLTGGSALQFVSGGTLQVSGSGTNTANAFTLGAGTLEVSSNLTISGAQSITGGTLQLDSGSTLTDTSGISVSSGTFTGQGTVAADLTGSGTGVIKASGGVLDVTGTLTGGSSLRFISGGKLQVSGSGTNTANAFTLGAGTLEVSSNLTISGLQTVAGGTLQLDSGSTTLTDMSGLKVSSGTLTGQGTVNVGTGTLTGSGTGVIIASGGVLNLSGTGGKVTGGSSLQVADGSVLKISATGSNTSNAITLDTSNKTLEVASNLTISGLQTVAGGTIQLDSGATLTDTSGITVSSGTLTGQGTVIASIADNATIDVSGGTLNITGNVTGTGLLTIENSSTLDLQNTASTGVSPVVKFNGTLVNNQIVQIDSNASTYSLTVQGSSWLYASQKFDFTKISFASASGSYNSSTHVYTLTDGTHTASITVSGGKSGTILIAQDSGTGTYVYDPLDSSQGAPASGSIGNTVPAADGDWALQLGAAGTQTVSFAGAMDNVEAYAPGLPIFALAGDDHLTGAGGNDLFVFAQSIGHDDIYNFNAASDKIDLIGFAHATSFGDIQANLADDANGDAVIGLGDGQSITLRGVDASLLTAGNFVFDQTPIVDNAGRMDIGDDAMLPLSGTIDNTGTIALNSIGHETDLQLIGHGVTFSGGGQVILSDNSQNFISGTDPSVTLTNVDNTISGAGHLGNGQLTLINHGTIIADGYNALVIDTGANVIANSGTMQSTGAGGLIINSDIANSGLLWADGGNVTVHGNVSGSGSAIIDGSAVLEFTGADSSSVIFHSANGELILDHSTGFTGTISGFTGDGTLAGSDQLDLRDINFSSLEQSSYANGVLTVSDGTHTANLDFNGDYELANFKFSADGHGGTTVYDPPVTGESAPTAGDITKYAPADNATTDTIATDRATFLKDTVTNFKSDMNNIAQSFSDQIQHILDTAHDGHGKAPWAAIMDALGATGTNSAQSLQASMADAKSGFESFKDTASAHNSTWGNLANGTLNGNGGNDAFVFKPNLGHDTSANFNPARDSITTDHTIATDFQHLLDTWHHDVGTNPVIAADANTVLHDLFKNQLLQHVSDFHFG
jgi:hypothetical protein